MPLLNWYGLKYMDYSVITVEATAGTYGIPGRHRHIFLQCKCITKTSQDMGHYDHYFFPMDFIIWEILYLFSVTLKSRDIDDSAKIDFGFKYPHAVLCISLEPAHINGKKHHLGIILTENITNGSQLPNKCFAKSFKKPGELFLKNFIF